MLQNGVSKIRFDIVRLPSAKSVREFDCGDKDLNDFLKKARRRKDWVEKSVDYFCEWFNDKTKRIMAVPLNKEDQFKLDIVVKDVQRSGKITAEIKDEVYKYKKKIYFTTDLQKYNDSKLITAGCNNIYIIDIQTLELETTINLKKTIRKILIRPKGNIFVLTYVQEIYKMDMNRETTPNFVQYFLNNIKIDFKTNEMTYKDEKDITEQAGIYNSFFDMYNYPNNGLVVNIDKSKLIIYDNFDD